MRIKAAAISAGIILVVLVSGTAAVVADQLEYLNVDTRQVETMTYDEYMQYVEVVDEEIKARGGVEFQELPKSDIVRELNERIAAEEVLDDAPHLEAKEESLGKFDIQ